MEREGFSFPMEREGFSFPMEREGFSRAATASDERRATSWMVNQGGP
jgi:hypothetical protein